MRPAELNYFVKNLDNLRGIGPRVLENYKKLFKQKTEVNIKDLVLLLPYKLIERKKNPQNLKEHNGKEILIEGEVISSGFTKGRKKIFRAKILTPSGFVSLVFYNVNVQYISSNLSKGKTAFFAGKLDKYQNDFQIIHPKIISNEKIIDKYIAEPIYPLTSGLANISVIKNISEILQNIPDLKEWQDPDFLKKNNWKSFKESITKIHNPKDNYDLSIDSKSRMRLAYDELLANQLAIGLTRKSTIKKKGTIIKSKKSYIKDFLSLLPFKLTDGQNSALKDIFKDLESENKMFRLIQGDVGCGKTAVAAITILQSCEAGFQAGFMAPTEILARQQYEWFIKEFGKSSLKEKIKICLLVGSLKPSEKKKLQQEILMGEYDIIVGTHSLFQEKVAFKNLGLIVIDEQHRFGVQQRVKLAEKGGGVNVLFMTATPIPRTLSMTLYGDMEISLIKDKPSGRQEIDTRALPITKIDEVISGIKRAIEQGDRIYWICPLVESNEEENISVDDPNSLTSAEERFKYLNKIFKGKVGIVHGQMKAKDKEDALEDFKSGKTSLLVATTVIEVGVNVPEANIIMIENSERFGLSQLHQLRGRVGRGAKKSSCLLLYSAKISDIGRNRLKIMRETNDGFKIAEEDMVLRGSGEILGTKQSGIPNYSFAVLPEHKELLFAARDDTKIIIEKDPDLSSSRGNKLRQLLYFFEYDLQVKNLEG